MFLIIKIAILLSVTFLGYYGNILELRISDENIKKDRLSDYFFKNMILSLVSVDGTDYYRLRPINIVYIGQSIYQFHFTFICSTDLYIAKLKIYFKENNKIRSYVDIDEEEEENEIFSRPLLKKKPNKGYKYIHVFNTSIVKNHFGKNNNIESKILDNIYTTKSECTIY